MAVYLYSVLSLSSANAGRIPWVARTLRTAAVCAEYSSSGIGDHGLGELRKSWRGRVGTDSIDAPQSPGCRGQMASAGPGNAGFVRQARSSVLPWRLFSTHAEANGFRSHGDLAVLSS